LLRVAPYCAPGGVSGVNFAGFRTSSARASGSAVEEDRSSARLEPIFRAEVQRRKITSQQQYTGQATQEAQDAAGGVENPGIDFLATVTACELRFEEEPQTELRFWGHPERNSVSVNESKNLPEKVQQGVTYRDVSVRSRIASELVATEEEPDATKAARQKAERLQVNLHKVKGSSVDGRITYKDVRREVQG
jgi:pyruvate/2-oxoglutarate dehydrogenase complex dihydrolipoamide acyltransferase (E2) component